MSVNIVTDTTELLVCISLSLSPGPNQLQLVCCPAAAGAHSTLVTGQTRISGPERERDGHPDSASLSDDLNISQQSRGRSQSLEAERASHNQKASSLFLCPRNFQFSFSPSKPRFLLSCFYRDTQDTTNSGQQTEGRACKILSDKTTKKVKLTVYQS